MSDKTLQRVHPAQRDDIGDLEGSLAHRDNAGHESVIRAGGVQWMTAGSGIVHAEVAPRGFLEQGGAVEILQLWVNLPSRLKMSAPAYLGLQREDLPALHLDEGKVTMQLIAGEWEGRPGPVQSPTGVFMSTLDMRAGGRFRATVRPPRKVFLYLVRGSIAVGHHGDLVNAYQLVELGDAAIRSICTPRPAPCSCSAMPNKFANPWWRTGLLS